MEVLKTQEECAFQHTSAQNSKHPSKNKIRRMFANSRQDCRIQRFVVCRRNCHLTPWPSLVGAKERKTNECNTTANSKVIYAAKSHIDQLLTERRANNLTKPTTTRQRTDIMNGTDFRADRSVLTNVDDKKKTAQELSGSTLQTSLDDSLRYNCCARRHAHNKFHLNIYTCGKHVINFFYSHNNNKRTHLSNKCNAT